ncbi:MAG: LPS export ABC transporter periplasmic protein LptC [Caulobacterales bacterium]|jgi:lipopolysaccharide export system protein LptC
MADAASLAPSPANHWQPRRRLTLDQARARSAFLRVWRMACVAIAAAAAGSILLAMVLHTIVGGYQADREIAAEQTLTMIAPRFTGRQESGSTFEITAATARRRAVGEQIMLLDKPIFKNQSGQTLTAASGVYDPTKRTVELFGEVVASDANGGRFTTGYALVDAENNVVVGKEPLLGRSGLGEVRSDTYELRKNGGHVIMRGRVRGTIRQSGAPATP